MADSPTPEAVQGLSAVSQIAMGWQHSCALRTSGRVFCWGHNGFNALGDGTSVNRSSPVRVQGLANATRIDPGQLHSCGLRADGTAFCWGRNVTGQLGDGTTTGRLTPVQVVN